MTDVPRRDGDGSDVVSDINDIDPEQSELDAMTLEDVIRTASSLVPRSLLDFLR